MNYDNVLQAILLLCSYFNKNESRNVKPLTPTEYSRLAAWLHQNQCTPADFLTREEELLSQWNDPKNKITKERLASLLQRAASMGFALEKWQQQNVWVLSRASQDYPKVLRDKLGDTRAPLLYCIGNKTLLTTQGIGFVGSRDTNQNDEAFTQALAQQAVNQGFTIVSGGAKGVDQTSMNAALDAGGSAIGILADSLLKSATKSQYRTALQEGRLLLITPYYPEASFSTGSAMGRNKYIYALSKGVVVAKSDETGGTWAGATENLKKQWVPLWVRDIEQSGNQKLLELGGQALSELKVDFNELQANFSFPSAKNTAVQEQKEMVQPDLLSGDFFTMSDEASVETKGISHEQIDSQSKHDIEKMTEQAIEPIPELILDVKDNTAQHDGVKDQSSNNQPGKDQSQAGSMQVAPLEVFIDVFYQQLKQEENKSYTPKALAEQFPELTESIITIWLNTLEERGLIKRQGSKLAYTLIVQQSL
jgi:DNA processing protein